ncbi:MAG TPA: class I adenylate-forming enzyme family protein, partial [Longimicrobiales bacterium]|nr:class I adenylate-forming enzyme family protein [Longimicrobiales bacterium]
MMHTLLPDVVEHWADRSPEHQAITMGGAALSYKALWTRASRLAGALAERGVRRGERVVIFMDNVPDCAVALFGVWLADAVAVPVNAQTKEEKLGWILRHSEAVAMISEAHLAYAYAPVTAGSELRAVIAASTQGKDSDAAESLDAVVAGAPDRSLPRRNVPLDLALILYTSGTTGEPKGVMHTHQSLCFARDSIAAYLEVG